MDSKLSLQDNSRYFDGDWEVVIATDPLQVQQTLQITRESERGFTIQGDGNRKTPLEWRERDQVLLDATGTTTISLWSRTDRDRLLVLRDTPHGSELQGLKRTLPNPAFDPVSFFVHRGPWTIFAEAIGKASPPNPPKTKVHFRFAGDPAVFEVFADDHPEPYDRLVWNPANSTLQSLWDWRSISFRQESTTSNRIFGMFDARRILGAWRDGNRLARLMPHEGGIERLEACERDGQETLGVDDIAVWGADDG